MSKNSSRELKSRWKAVVDLIIEKFAMDDETINLDDIIYIIGLQELNHGYRKYSKNDKINLMHVAICSLLEPYGYYRFEQVDEQGWPHYSLKKSLPPLKPGEQTLLMKEAIIEYFLKRGDID